MNENDFRLVRELVAERLKWRAVVPVSVEILRETYGAEFFAEQVRLMIEVHLLSREVRAEVEYTLDVPTSWFQHLKRATLPGWLARRFPPRVNVVPITTKHYHNCPHLDVPRNGSAHLHWLAGGEYRDQLRAEILRWTSADKVTPARRSAWAETVRAWGYPAIAAAMDSEWAALEGRDG